MADTNSVNNEILLQLEQRAALELTQAERADTIAQMNAVLSYLAVLQTCPPLQSPEYTGSACPLRADDVQPSAERSDLLANCPETDGVFFLVPRTVE